MRAWWLVLAGGLLACDGGETGDPLPDGPLSPCDPLDPSLCALPFPSSHFLVEDTTTPTGFRVQFGAEALPMNRDGVRMTPDSWNRKDGFSINSRLVTHVPGLDPANLISHVDLDGYAATDATTVIIDTVTGQRVPHWAELDMTAPDPTATDDQRVLILHPAVPYEFGRRYVVGLRNLRKGDGSPVAVSPAFAALRDGAESGIPDVAVRRDHFDTNIFPALENQGFARGELVLAWDFVTASRQGTLGDVEHVRDLALDSVTAAGPAYQLTKVEDRDCSVEGEHIARHIEGTFTAPFYTTENLPGTFLARGEDGLPLAMGDKQVQFIVRVPCSVAHGADGTGAVAESAAILQYGHGLLGDHYEVNGGYLADLADRYGWVLFASAWTGFKSADVLSITLMIALDPGKFGFVGEGSQQGMAEFALGLRMMMGGLAEDEALTFDGQQVIDPERRFYYGNSQGAIMGTAYMGLSTDLQRGVLGVGGGPYSLLLSRSSDFDDFFRVFKEKYDDHRDIALFIFGLSQQVWDPVEPGGWMWDINRDTDNPKDLLLQVAIGDNQVTTLGAQYQARAYGAKSVAPAVRPIWGVEEQEAPFTGSAIVEWEYLDGPTEPVENLPPQQPDTHEKPRRERAAQDQMRDFLEEGVVNQYCDGPCTGWFNPPG